jgi:hypothetical protein
MEEKKTTGILAPDRPARTLLPFPNCPPSQNQIGTKWNGIASTAPILRSPPCPYPVPQCTLFPYRLLSQRARNTSSTTLQTYGKKLRSATSKNIYCNIEKYVLQHQKLCIATSQTVVLQHRKINHETWKMKTFENHLLQQPKISLQHSKIICSNIQKNTLQHEETTKGVQTARG